MSEPTRFESGVNIGLPWQTLAMYGLPDPTVWHTYFNDFDTYTAADWTVTEVGVATQALTDADDGILLITNAAADNDMTGMNKVGESFLFETNKKLLFKSRFKVSDATQSDFVMGLQITDTTPLAVTDGVFFQKDDGDANLDFHVTKDSTATDSTALATVADDTFLDVGFYYDGDSEIKIFVDNDLVGTSVVTNLPDDEELTISLAIQNGEAVAKTMSVDYIFVAKER